MPDTTAAIMALPTPLESIRLVGDEDKHATLLFFGETSTLPNDAKSTITSAVEQASKMLFPFSEHVRDVTRLGTESPPALIAMLSNDNLTQVRNLFMMNPSINNYLDNTLQFPQFTAHVTLGYPDYTEEVVLRTLMQSIYRIQFDRLAVWWNDERIEFPLNVSLDSDSIAMSEAIENALAHISEKPWSDYTEADYTLEQYAAACLVVPPKAQLTSKSQCKLPVKTPDGALNRNGVHAAAGALAGARGGVQLSADERASAEKKLIAYYKQLGEDAPAFLTHSNVDRVVEGVLSHHGVKGQKWGVRRAVNSATGLVTRSKKSSSSDESNLKPRTGSADQIHQDRIAKKIKESGTASLSNADMQAFTRRLQLNADLDRALASQSAQLKAKSDGFIKKTIKSQGSRQFDRVLNKATDIAVEKALESAGLKLGKKGFNPDVADIIVKTSGRLKPKKGK